MNTHTNNFKIDKFNYELMNERMNMNMKCRQSQDYNTL